MDFFLIEFGILRKLLAALVFSLPLAFNREEKGSTAGLRTFVIVSVTSCAFMLTGNSYLQDPGAEARLMQGLIGGLGFLGGGVILKNGSTIKGMATAASIWSAGAIGMAVAFSQWEIAIFVPALNWMSLRFGSKVKKDLSDDEKREAD